MRASLGRNLRKTLQGWNGESADRIVNLHAKLGTGLSRPDVYNWNTVTQTLVGYNRTVRCSRQKTEKPLMMKIEKELTHCLLHQTF